MTHAIVHISDLFLFCHLFRESKPLLSGVNIKPIQGDSTLILSWGTILWNCTVYYVHRS